MATGPTTITRRQAPVMRCNLLRRRGPLPDKRRIRQSRLEPAEPGSLAAAGQAVGWIQAAVDRAARSRGTACERTHLVAIVPGQPELVVAGQAVGWRQARVDRATPSRGMARDLKHLVAIVPG